MKKYLLLMSLGLFSCQGVSAIESAVIKEASAGKRDWDGFMTSGQQAAALAVKGAPAARIKALEDAYNTWEATQAAGVAASIVAGAPAAKAKAEAMTKAVVNSIAARNYILATPALNAIMSVTMAKAVAQNMPSRMAIFGDDPARKAIAEAVAQNIKARADIAASDASVDALVAVVGGAAPLRNALATRQHGALIAEIDRQVALVGLLHGDAAAIAGEIVGGGGHLKDALATHQHTALIGAIGAAFPADHAAHHLVLDEIAAAGFAPAPVIPATAVYFTADNVHHNLPAHGSAAQGHLRAAILADNDSRRAMTKAILQGPNPADNGGKGNGLWNTMTNDDGLNGPGAKARVRSAIVAASGGTIAAVDLPI